MTFEECVGRSKFGVHVTTCGQLKLFWRKLIAVLCYVVIKVLVFLSQVNKIGEARSGVE